MAKLTVMLPDDFLLKISKIEQNADEIVSTALQEGAKVYKEAMQQELDRVIGHGTKSESRSTGELQHSLGVTPTKIDANGLLNVRIGFNEPRKNQTADAHTAHKRRGRSKKSRSYKELTNAMIAATIEYGRTGQSPKPFQKRARKKAEEAGSEAASRALDREVGNL